MHKVGNGLFTAAALAVVMSLVGCTGTEQLAQQAEGPIGPLGKATSALTAQELDNAANRGITWTVSDTTAWVQANNCTACHRAPAPLYGASISAYTGYNVNTSSANGAGYLADFIAGKQYPDGSWSYDPTNLASMRYVNSAYASFGLAGYTQYVNSRYLPNLQRAIDWIIPNTASTFTIFPNDGKALQGVKATYVTQDRGAGTETLAYNEYIPTAQYAVATRAALDMGGLPSDKASNYQTLLRGLADYLVGKYARATANSWQPEDIAYAAIGALADSRDAGNNTTVAAMRDELLNRTVSGAWGNTTGYGSPNAYSTGMSLYALCRLGVRADQNATVSTAISWLVNNQCGAGNNYCGTADATKNGSWYIASHPADVPTTFAVLALGCYGSLNAQVTLSPVSVTLAPNLASTQTTSFNVTVKNTGYVTNTYSLVPSGNFAGMQISQNNPSMTLDPSGSATDVVTLVLPAFIPKAQTIPVSVTVSYLTPSGPANKTVTFNVYIPPQPNANADKTYVTILSPANGAVITPGTTVNFAATVKKVADNSAVTLGTLSIFSGGAAVATMQADGSGNFAFSWLVPTNTILGQQTFTAAYNGYATDNYSVNIGPSSANGTYTIGNSNGTVCANNAQCQTGFCVDGVCCDTACGGSDATDCQACSRFAGATTDGTCGAAKASTVCRPSRGFCDYDEVCDGTSLACPATDAVVPSGTSCGGSSASCNTTGDCKTPVRGLNERFYNSTTLGVLPTDPYAYNIVQGVSFDWGTGSPNASVNVDNFSSRWTGDVTTPYDATNPAKYTGRYFFTTQSDEGVRLWVNGRLIIDNWTSHTSTVDTGSIVLQANTRYSVKLEYYEGTGSASCILQWQPPFSLSTVIPNTSLTPAVNNPVPVRIKSPNDRTAYLSASTVVVDVDAPALNATVNSIDLLLNGVSQGLKTAPPYTWTLNISNPSSYVLTAKANATGYNNSNGQVPLTQWSRPVAFQVLSASSNTGAGLTADYYNGSNFGTFAFTRSDYTVALDGNVNTPLPDDISDLNNYSARWTGKVSPLYSQSYKFSVQTNQQAKVWVNNTLVVDTQANIFSGSIGLSAGVAVPIKVEYYKNNASSSLMKLFWESPSEIKGLVPGVRLFPSTASTH